MPLLFSLVACQDPAMFVPQLQDAQRRAVTGPAEDAVVSESANLNLNIDYRAITDQGANRLQVSVKDDNGQIVTTKTVESNELKSGARIQVAMPPAYADGQYSFDWTLFAGNKVLEKNTGRFFFLRSRFGIDSLQVMPGSCYPESMVLAKARLRTNAGLDPWIRWIVADQVAAEGPLSAGADTFHFEAPGSVGAYPLQVEIFPFGPKAGETWSTKGGVSATTSVIVSDLPPVGQKLNFFAPQALYDTIFFFEGNLRNTPGQGLALKASKPLTTSLFTDLIGYRLSTTEFLQSSDNLLTFDGVDLASQSVDLLFQVASLEPQVLYRVGTAKDPLAELSLVGDGVVEAKLLTSAGVVRLHSPARLVDVDRPVHIRLGIDRSSPGILRAVLIVDGTLADLEEQSLPDPNLVTVGPKQFQTGFQLGFGKVGVLGLGLARSTYLLQPYLTKPSGGWIAVLSGGAGTFAIPAVFQSEKLRYLLRFGQPFNGKLRMKGFNIHGLVVVDRQVELGSVKSTLTLVAGLSGKSLRLVLPDQNLTFTSDEFLRQATIELVDSAGRTILPNSIFIASAQQID